MMWVAWVRKAIQFVTNYVFADGTEQFYDQNVITN